MPGVDVTLQEFAGVVHMWMVIGPHIPESVQAFHDAGEFIRRHIT
jgi:acetyl esterase/lipase